MTVNLLSQSSDIIIGTVIIEGNHHTKDKVILREMNLTQGDTVPLQEISTRLEKDRLRILGTGLFNYVSINLKNYNPETLATDISLTIEENWYLFPVPIFELADRNFSVWWQEQNKSLDRVNYGFRLSHYNFTGNRDPLKLKVHFGYTRKYELNYQYPYLAVDNKLGIGGSIFYSERREIGYKTVGNKTLFAQTDDERKLLSRFRVGPELKYRPNTYDFHAIRIEYHHNKIDQFVAENLNSDYFLNGKLGIQFFYLEYDFNHDKRPYTTYPLSGHLVFGNIKKEGLGVFGDFDNLSITAGIEKHFPIIENKLSISTRNKAKTNIIRKAVSFANNTGLGYGTDIVTGYDLYVMDGTDYGISMNAIKYVLYDNNLNTAKWMPRQFRKMNLSLFLRFNIDFAYVNENRYTATNSLNNRIIYGYGPALDMILFNNFLFSFEYSFNDIGERGLYLSNAISF